MRVASSAVFVERAIRHLLEDAQARGLEIAALPAERILHNWHLLMELDGRIHPTLSRITIRTLILKLFIDYRFSEGPHFDMSFHIVKAQSA
ncbi:MAG: hypothetical protein HPY52_08650 [Firmicutes bacterium]|nr:hypothetical protein [Bacillota bacterium]